MLDWLSSFCVRLTAGALRPAQEFLSDGGARFYWAYCVSGLAIAAFLYLKHGEAKRFQAELLDKNVWASQSAINDYIILVITPVLRLTVLSWAALNWKTVAAVAVSVLATLGVSGRANDGTSLLLGFGLTLALFIVDDFLRYIVHYQFHRVPELWEFHKVHHSAEVLNFATAERHHPLEVIVTAAVLAVGLGIVNGIFIAFFGAQVTAMTIAGANALLFAFNICGGVLRHSPFWVSFGPSAERWVISPAMHQIHHSEKPEHFDRNFGGSLAVWDRMFGTIHIPQGREIEGYGIGVETRDFRALETILVRPFTASARLLGKRIWRALEKGAVTHANGAPVEG